MLERVKFLKGGGYLRLRMCDVGREWEESYNMVMVVVRWEKEGCVMGGKCHGWVLACMGAYEYYKCTVSHTK
jgi:hypothetical protein